MIEEPVSTAQLMEAVDKDETLEWRQEQASPVEPVDENWPEPESMLDGEVINDLRSRWNTIQIEFVDQPHASVEQAGALVAEAMATVTQALAEKQRILDERWVNRDEVTTEDLRLTVQQYRSFFNYLLSF